MAMRSPAARGYGRSRYFTAADVAYIRLMIDLHDVAECELPDCPVARLGDFLADLERELEKTGSNRVRAQLWGSLFLIPAPANPVRLAQRVPVR